MPSAGAVAVISDAFWQQRFGRSPSVVGVGINLTPVTIVGVAPTAFSDCIACAYARISFSALSIQPLIFPVKTGSLLSMPIHERLQIMGRLQPGAL